MLGIACSFLSSVTWAVGVTVYAQHSLKWTGYQINWTRALVSLPVFAILALLTGASLSTLNAFTLGWMTVSILCSYGLGDLCFFAASRKLGVPSALAISSAYPIWNYCFALLVGEEAANLRKSLAVIWVVLSVAVVILTGPRALLKESKSRQNLEINSVFWIGLVFAVVTSLFWAANSYAISKLGKNSNLFLVNAVRMALAAAIVQVLGLIHLRKRVVGLPISELRIRGWAYLFESVGGATFYVYGLGHTAASIGPVLSSLAPVITVPFAWWTGAERISLARLLGVTSVVIGLWLLLGS